MPRSYVDKIRPASLYAQASTNTNGVANAGQMGRAAIALDFPSKHVKAFFTVFAASMSHRNHCLLVTMAESFCTLKVGYM